jgi:spore coat polysaccharide biosynthesis protein SpsF (cytidylyltransferase family)
MMSFEALERAWRETSEKHQREHVTPYFYETAPPDEPTVIPGWGRSWHLADRNFDILLLDHPQDFGEVRWTVDTPQDLQLVRELASRLPQDRDFTWLDVLQVYQSAPELVSINSMIVHRTHIDTDERA